MLLAKLGTRSAFKSKWEFVALVAIVALPLSLYVISGFARATLVPLFKNYLVKCYGDVIVLGYIPNYIDEVLKNYTNILKDYTGYAVVPSYGISNGKTYPLLLGYTEAAYRNNTLLGGFKAPPLKKGQAVLLREGSSFLHPGMELTIYPSVVLRPVPPFREKIVGYAEGGLPLPAGPVVFLNKKDGEELVKDFGGYTVYSFIFKKGISKEEALEFVKRVLRDVGAYTAFIFYSKSDLIFYPGEAVILGSERILKYLSLTSWIVVTIILIIISIINIEKNLREMSTIRSLGATKRHLFEYMFAKWFTVTQVGAIVALLVGAAVASATVNAMLSHPRLEPLKYFVRFSVDPLVVVVVEAMATVTALLTSVISMIFLSRMNLIEAMRFYGLKMYIKVESSLTPPLMLAASELRSMPWKSVSGIIILLLGASLIVTPLMLNRSLHSLDVPKTFDVQITTLRIPKISLPYSTVLPQLSTIKHAKTITVWLENLYGYINFRSKLSFDGKEMYVKAMTCVEAIKGNCKDNYPPLVTGSYPHDVHEIAISEVTAKDMGLKVGDEVTLTFYTLERVIRVKAKVVGIYKDPLYPPTIMFDKDVLKGINIFDAYKTFIILINADDPKYQDQVAKAAQTVFVSNAYAAASKTWKSFLSNIKMNVSYLGYSYMMAMIVGFSVIAVSTIVYAFTELVTKSRLLALLKALGLMASDIVKANVAKWLVYSIVAAAVLPLAVEAFYYWGWEVLSTVYYSPYLGFDVNYCIVTLIILPLVALVTFLVYRTTEVVEELRV